MKLETLKRKLKGFQTIESMESPSRTGGPVANQFIIRFENATVFQSYDSIIAVEISEKVRGENKWRRKTYLTDAWDYSVTTGKYRNIFLGETKKETLAKIISKEYIVLK